MSGRGGETFTLARTAEMTITGGVTTTTHSVLKNDTSLHNVHVHPYCIYLGIHLYMYV